MGRISHMGQIKIYLGKCFRLFVNEKQWKNFFSTFLIMILISLVTSEDMFLEYNDTNNGAFAIICACIWVGLFNSIQSICKERKIIKREHMTGLHISSYVIAHVAYEFFLSATEAFIVILVVAFMNYGHMPESGVVSFVLLDLYITMLLVIFASDMLALLVSCIVKREQTAMTVMPFVLIIQLVMAGLIFPLKGITKIISAFTLSRWGLDAIIAVANTNSEVKLDFEAAVWNGRADDFEPLAHNLLMFWGILLLFAAVYIALAILSLEGVDKDKR